MIFFDFITCRTGWEITQIITVQSFIFLIGVNVNGVPDLNHSKGKVGRLE